MKQNGTYLQFSLATVSPEGLVFENRVYTNSLMIRLQWFEHAALHGNWKIPIFFLTTNHEQIFLLDTNSIQVATSVENPTLIDEKVKQVYQAEICQLKELISEKKSGGKI